MTKQEAKILARNAGLRFREMIDEFCNGNQKEFSKKTGIGESSITGYLSHANVRLILLEHTKKDPRRSESLWGLINDSVLQSICSDTSGVLST